MADLSQVNMLDNKKYYFKDSEARTIIENLDASDVSYNNTTSIEDDNVKEALDSICSDITPKLLIRIDSGSSITITNGTTTITGTSVGGEFLTGISTLGVWTITATLGSKTTSDAVTISKLGKTYLIELSFFTAELIVYSVPNTTIYVDGKNRGVVPIPESGSQSSPSLSIQISGAGTHTCYAVGNGVQTGTSEVTFSTEGETIELSLENVRMIVVDSLIGTTVTLTNGNITYQNPIYQYDDEDYDRRYSGFWVPSDGTWTATATLSGKTASDGVVVSGYDYYSISLDFVHIYGVEWDGSSSPALSRTDDSALFVDPDPYVADGNHPGSSPFDNLMPWSGIVKETLGTDVFVKIPKFWFKITTDGTRRKIQIADKEVDGFSVSPAHQDRGDGKGERDYIYVSRYHVSTGYKSISGVYPLGKITRSGARTGCSGRGTGYCQFDMMTLITIWYLYLVEFAHWDSQEKIGYGGSSGGITKRLGASDTMPYHTGTMKSSRAAYDVGTQYRWIEDLWGNVLDWVDGIYFSSAYIYAIKNPANFSDSSGGKYVGTRPTTSTTNNTNEIKAWKDSTVSGYKWFVYPSAVEANAPNNYTTYCCDQVLYDSSGVTLKFGSTKTGYRTYGLFSLYGNSSSSYSSSDVGARLMYLP